MAPLVTPQSVSIIDCDCLTPFGDSVATHSALLRGERALQAIAVGGAAGGDLAPLALLPGRSLDETTPPSWLGAIQKMLRPVSDRKWGSARLPVFVTSSNFGVGNLLAYRRDGDARHLAYGSPFLCVQWLREALGWQENVAIYSHACVSAHLGLLQASRIVGAGLADAALIVSFDLLSPFVAGGFHSLKILNADFPAPYQERATGSIGLGDGAAYAVIERGGPGIRLEAQSLHNEMHHFTANQADGAGFVACLRPIFEQIKGRRIWIKGHGTGTLEAGRLESKTLAALFPEAPLTGWKGSLGHTLGSCGLVELAVVLQSIRGGRVPGTVGTSAPTMTGNVAIEEFSTAGYSAVLCASNAFGGAHAAFLLSYD